MAGERSGTSWHGRQPRRWRWHRAVLAAVCGLAVLACDGGAPVATVAKPPAAGTQDRSAVRPLSLPAGPVAHAPWAAVACTQGQPAAGQLACVDGVAITRSQFDAAWAVAPPAATSRAVLQSLIDAELLAQAAARAGGWRDPQLPHLLKQRLASVLLDRHAATVTPQNLAAADIEHAYRNPQIQPRYDHVDAWFAIDAQLLCCSGDPRQCAKREDVQSCIDNLSAQAQAVHAALAADPPKSADEMWAKTRVLGARMVDVVPAEVHFYYDKSKAYGQQRGYDLVVREFAEAVTALQPGQLHPPVRSAFGWHIPFLSKVDPAVHKDWRDPAVRDEIASHIVDLIRGRESQRLGFEAMRRHGVEFFYDRLEPRAAVPPQ